MHHWTSCTSVHIPFTSDLLNKLTLLLYSIHVNSAEPIIAIGQLALALLESNIYWYFTTNWQKEKGDDIIMLNVCWTDMNRKSSVSIQIHRPGEQCTLGRFFRSNSIIRASLTTLQCEMLKDCSHIMHSCIHKPL